MCLLFLYSIESAQLSPLNFAPLIDRSLGLQLPPCTQHCPGAPDSATSAETLPTVFMLNTRIAISTIFGASRAARTSTASQLSTSAVRRAKDDSSTIDSYRLPSQTSINEWEFKYDFIPKTSEPKIPPVTREAIKQDIAHDKRAKVESEMQREEHHTSVKVEANDAAVVHGGESVGAEPEFLQDRGSKPVDASIGQSGQPRSKPANRDKYIQSSINPEINQSDIVHLGENEVDHKVASVKEPIVVEDHEHDQDHNAGQPRQKNPNLSAPFVVPLGFAGLVGAYFWFTREKKERK